VGPYPHPTADHRDTVEMRSQPWTPLELRALVPALQSGTYLNYGAHGPSPRPVAAAQDFLATHEFDVPTSDDPYAAAFDACDRARRRIARGRPVRPSVTRRVRQGER
jgi:hypothetical protein